jgi:hypothetical protein
MIAIIEALALLFLGSALVDLAMRVEPNSCTMSYMWPSYVRVSSEAPYALFLYREAHAGLTSPLHRLTGRPVLFLPGQAGSYRQVRSFGTASFALEAAPPHDAHAIDWFTVDFADEWSALSGEILARQTDFAEQCVRRILTLYEHMPLERRPRAVPLVGHSMGGVLARAVAVRGAPVGTVLALHSPLLRPAVSVHWSVDRFYGDVERDCAQRDTRRPSFALLSLGGGLRDALVPADLSALPACTVRHVAAATVLPSIEGIQRSADHQCGVWCLEVAQRVALAFRQMAAQLDAFESAADARARLDVLQRHLGARFRSLDHRAPRAPDDAVPETLPLWLPQTNATIDIVVPSGAQLALVTTSAAARIADGGGAPMLLPARDGVAVDGSPLIDFVSASAQVRELSVQASETGVSLLTRVADAEHAVTARSLLPLLGSDRLLLTSVVSRFRLSGLAPSLALELRHVLRDASCRPRFLSRAVWSNSAAEPLLEDYFVGLGHGVDSSAVRFFADGAERTVLVVADADCVAAVELRLDWMATAGHALRLNWQLLFRAAVAAAMLGASLSARSHRAQWQPYAFGVASVAAAAVAAVDRDPVAAFLCVVTASGLEAVLFHLVAAVVQPLLRLVARTLALPFAFVVGQKWRVPLLAVVVAALSLFDAAAALLIGVLALAAASQQRRVLLLPLLLVAPILATSTMVRIHAFTEAISQWHSGATHFGAVGVVLPLSAVLLLLSAEPAPSSAQAALGAMALFVYVAPLSLIDVLSAVAVWAACVTAAEVLESRAKQKES